MTDKEKQELLHRVVCYYINNPEIPYEQRKPVSEEIVPYVEELQKVYHSKILEDEGMRLFTNMDNFNAGDIVCSVESVDYYQSVFELPEDFDPEGSFNPGPYLVDYGEGYELVSDDDVLLYHEDGIYYRYATEEERKLLNKLRGE